VILGFERANKAAQNDHRVAEALNLYFLEKATPLSQLAKPYYRDA
jgi:hypothetical protein